jgi:hypothetical protein
MTRQTYNEFLDLQDFLSSISSDLNEEDAWICIWGPYASSKFYQFQFTNHQVDKALSWVWKSDCIPKIKFFPWFLLNDRLNTRNILRRRYKLLEEGYNYVMCLDDKEETVEHLFFECPTAVCRWFSLGIVWDSDANLLHKVHLARRLFTLPFFMDIFLIAAWCLWKERNDYIFNNAPPSLATWKRSFKAAVKEHFIRIKSSLHQSILLWLDAL